MSIAFINDAVAVSGMAPGHATALPKNLRINIIPKEVTQFGISLGDIADVVTAPAKAAVAVAETTVETAGDAAGIVGDAVGEIPIVGTPLAVALDIAVAPVGLAQAIARGERIDEAVISNIKKQIKNVQDIAPYAQIVVSFVPGIGTGIGAAIAAGVALSEGKSITEAVVAAAQASIPGGPIAQAAFNVSYSVASGQPIDEVALAAVPLPPEQKELIKSGVSAAKALGDGKAVNEAIVKVVVDQLPGTPEQKKALTEGLVIAKEVIQGKPVDSIAYNRGKEYLPPEVQGAIQIATSLAQAKSSQEIDRKWTGLSTGKLEEEGNAVVPKMPELRSTVALLPEPVFKGFTTGVGLLEHKINPTQLAAAREKLDANGRFGFDLALAVKIGMVRVPRPKKKMTPGELFGYYVTWGMIAAEPHQKEEFARILIKSQDMRNGATKALAEIKKAKEPWWRRTFRFVFSIS